MTVDSTHNKMSSAVWVVVHLARTTTGNRYRVVQYPGQKRWSVVDQNCNFPTKLKTIFDLRCYKSHQEHQTACRKAIASICKWQKSLYRQFKNGWDVSLIPKDNTREQLLKMAVRENNAEAIRRIAFTGANIGYVNGLPIRLAMRKQHWDAVVALIKAGASITVMRDQVFAPEVYTKKSVWLALLTQLARLIEHAKLDENLPVFDDLASLAQDPICRPVVTKLAQQYPGLSAKML